MHLRLAGELDRQASGRLLDYDHAHYRRWIDRALTFAAVPGRPSARRRSIEWLAPRYEAASEELLVLPRTIIHGEFYASNVLVAGDPAEPRVAPVDWELAATAPGVIDLAALVSGGWSEEDRGAIAAAYRTAAGPFSPSPRELDLARLCLAVQWLGWAEPSWRPPMGQRQDWLAEALSLAEGLEL
jgi:aminoglycoside phosphotransferase (APT) family kinase protein